jgi:cysteine desulfurase/selenocysteine lyase
MGYQKSAPTAAPESATPLWQAWADEFPVTKNLVYLNHAGVSPLPRRVAEAIAGWAREAMEWGSYFYSRWLETYEGLRQAAARLLGASRDEIAIVKNTSEGIAAVAIGLDWRPGDRIVVFTEEFPANYLPWKKLERRGVRLTELSVFDPLEKIEQACRGARLLALSFVQYLSGYRADVEAIGAICRRNGCLFLLDAIQGLAHSRWTSNAPRWTCSLPTATSGCSVPRAAASSMCAVKCRKKSNPWNSAGPTWPITMTSATAT